MLGNWPQNELPNLADDNCDVVSDQKNRYNCIAWAAGDNTKWWWPSQEKGISYWPKGAPQKETIDAFICAFGTLGYSICATGSLQEGVEKVVLFAKRQGERLVPTHAARQLECGSWASKLGPFEDIIHFRLEAVNGPLYGQPVRFICRPRHQPPIQNS